MKTPWTLAIYAKSGRQNNFHLIRHLAAGLVVLTHSFSIITGAYESEPLVGLLGRSAGMYAVDMFFVVSGFLIAQSLAREPDIMRFAAARALRIFPALTLAVAFTALVIGPATTVLPLADYFADPDLARHIVGSLTTLASGTPLPGVFTGLPDAGAANTPLWTLKYEIAAYVSLALVAVPALALGRPALPFAAAAVLIAHMLVQPLAAEAGSPPALGHIAHLFLAFYLGVLGFALRRQIPLAPAGVILLVGLGVLAEATLAAELAQTAALAYGVLWAAFQPWRLARQAERIGDASYGIYIYAFPVQQTLRLAFPAIAPLELFVASLALVLPLALASWHIVEKPCLGLCDGLGRRSHPAVASARQAAPAPEAAPGA